MSFAEDRRRDALVRYRKNRAELEVLVVGGIAAILAIYVFWRIFEGV